MSFESNIGLREECEQSPILNRFDHLVELMKKEANAEGGWITIPPRTLLVNSKSELVGFFVFLPRPITDYESKYDPSITMQIGEYKYGVDGKPSGNVKQTFIRRSNLEDLGLNQQRAENEFENIEEGFFGYKNFTEISLSC